MRAAPLASVVFLAAAAWGQEQGLSPTARQALEERTFLRTVEEQGGRSHASGDRPELGPTHRSGLSLTAAATIRVGLTPTSFGPQGAVLLEYHTAAAHNHDRVELTATGFFAVFDTASGDAVFSGFAGEAVTFTRSGTGIAVSARGRTLGSFASPLRARPLSEDSILVVGSMRRINRLAPLVAGAFQLTPPPYRGELEVLAGGADPARLRLVNLVEIEDYVPGVVVNESLSSFHVEALRAQAITARGYAVANRGRFADRGFDIDDSTLSQVYRGQSSETGPALEAARSTLGLVVLHEGRILSALYSSSMGGHTESNEYVFAAGGYPGTNAHPALRGIHDSAEALPADLGTEEGVMTFYTTVYPGSYETSPATGAPLTSLHRWTRTRSAPELLARLKESFGVPASARRITDLRTTIRGDSGRMMQVMVSGDWGSATISGWSDLRRLATLAGVTPGGTGGTSAPNSPSTYLIARDAAGDLASVTFLGGGFGHNVGMSQFGSHGRALRGQTAEQILGGYYTATEVGTAPQLLLATAARQRFRARPGPAVLTVENAGLDALILTVNGRRFELRPRRSDRVQVDVSRLLRDGINEVEYAPRGEGAAVVAIRLPAAGLNP